MNVTVVSIRPSEAAHAAGKPELTPELLAATMARYSRSNEGLGTILSKVKFGNREQIVGELLHRLKECEKDTDTAEEALDELKTLIRMAKRIDAGDIEGSVDSVLRMADYGHASIRDLAPVPVFIDGLSIGLIALLWNLCPIGAGQESSTRYLKFDTTDLVDAELLGIPPQERVEWESSMATAFGHYHTAVKLWEDYADMLDGVLCVIPDRIRLGPDKKLYQRMLRNYAFDRARVFLPVAAKSNVALLLSGGEWVRLIQILLSGPTPEMNQLGTLLKEELKLVIPRMLGHAIRRDYWEAWWEAETEKRRSRSTLISTAYLGGDYVGECPVETELHLYHGDAPGIVMIEDMAQHKNRYAPFGTDITRMGVRWSWDGIAMAEVRDVNRHRSGTRFLDLIPRGFHNAHSECLRENKVCKLDEMAQFGMKMGMKTRLLINEKRPDFLSWMLLGTQVGFSHTTTLDKLIYETELRTGVGAHYRYAGHERALLQELYSIYPELRGNHSGRQCRAGVAMRSFLHYFWEGWVIFRPGLPGESVKNAVVLAWRYARGGPAYRACITRWIVHGEDYE